MPDDAPGIEIRGLTKRFGATAALDGVDLTVPRGRVLALLGPNGAGKTSLVRIAATLLRPDAGRVAVAGFDVVRQAARVRRVIALSGQHTTVDEELTGVANLVLVGRLLDLSRRAAAHRAADLLDRVGLTEHAGQRVATYSGGMRRRLDLAVTLVGQPRVVFLDEPSAGLDPGRRDDLWQIIRGLAADGVTVVLTTQYLEEADALADAVAVLRAGRIVAAGTLVELKRRIGGHVVDLRLAHAADVPAATALLAAATGAAPTVGGHLDLAVPVSTQEAFFTIAAGLREHGIAVHEAALRLPGLDAVFRALTADPDHRTDDRSAA